MGFVISMREVESGDIHTGIKHFDETVDIPTGGSKGADDLGFALLNISGFEDAVKLNFV
jgi:hypothetical protein